MMVTWIDNAAHVVWDVEKKGFAPKNDADWLELEDHSTQLAVAGSLLPLGGNGPADAAFVGQDGWKAQSEALTKAANAVHAAAKARDLKALIAANGDLTTACETCHKAYKPSLPTEGVVHQSPHSESHAHN